MADDMDGIEPDHPLLLAAAVGLFAERVGRPLFPWQQRLIDAMELQKAREEARRG